MAEEILQTGVNFKMIFFRFKIVTSFQHKCMEEQSQILMMHGAYLVIIYQKSFVH